MTRADRRVCDRRYEAACKLFYGEGRRCNRPAALKQIRELAERGHVLATHAMGLALVYGLGCRKQPKKGFGLLMKAAKARLLAGCFCVGCCYEEGTGVRKDLDKAIRWYRMSARHGCLDSMCNLGVCCEKKARHSRRATRWLSEASRWYSLAARRGHVWATNNLGLLLMNEAKTAGDLKKAERYLLAAAKKKDVLAAYNLGLFYDGQSDLRDPRAARKWYGVAASNGMAKAQHNLGIMLKDGDGGPKDQRQGLRWIRKASKQGDRMARRVLRSLHS